MFVCIASLIVTYISYPEAADTFIWLLWNNNVKVCGDCYQHMSSTCGINRVPLPYYTQMLLWLVDNECPVLVDIYNSKRLKIWGFRMRCHWSVSHFFNWFSKNVRLIYLFSIVLNKPWVPLSFFLNLVALLAIVFISTSVDNLSKSCFVISNVSVQ